jgi:hypothetical protein
MSKRQDKPPVRIDQSVTRAYREIADERTPGHLDRAVLARAARAGRPGYARSRAWTRPLAWAATIVLSVAIVLEFTQTPAPEDVASWEAPASLDEARTLAQPNSTEPGDSDAPVPGRAADLIPDTREKSSPVQKTSAQMTVESTEAAPRLEAAAPKSEPAPIAADAETRDAGLVDRTAQTDALQNPPSRQAFSLRAPAATRTAPAPSRVAAAHCSPEDTRQPSTWLACIEELERAGLVDEAAEEQRHLREAFPGFELP